MGNRESDSLKEGADSEQGVCGTEVRDTGTLGHGDSHQLIMRHSVSMILDTEVEGKKTEM